MTNLSASELTKLTTMIDGQPRGRLASSLKTFDRLKATLAKAIGGEDKAAKVLEQALICETYGGAEAVIKRHLPKAAEEPTADQPKPSRPKREERTHAAIAAIAKPSAVGKSEQALGDIAAALKPARQRASTAALEEAAKLGTIPPAPDFSAPTHARFRGKLAEVIALIAAEDIAGLESIKINPISSSPKALDRYRNLALIALRARKAA